MTTRGVPSIPFRPLTLCVALACALAACKGEPPSPPVKPGVAASTPAPVRTKEQAMTDLMELAEVKAWSAQIEKRSRGTARGAVIEDDATPTVINGKKYWQLSFVENRRESIHRLKSFLVAQSGNEILVEDTETGGVLSLDEWRRGIERVDIKAAK